MPARSKRLPLPPVDCFIRMGPSSNATIVKELLEQHDAILIKRHSENVGIIVSPERYAELVMVERSQEEGDG